MGGGRQPRYCAARSLLIRNGEPRSVSAGVARELGEHKAGRRLTNLFSPFASEDRAMLEGLISSNYALSRIPFPY